MRALLASACPRSFRGGVHCALAIVLLLATSNAHAVPLLGGADFVFTSDGGAMETSGNPANTADGMNANGPFSDQTIGVQYKGMSLVLPVVFEYSFNQVVDVFGDFTLYNGWDVQNQGIDGFTLTFFDTLDVQIGNAFSGNAANAAPSAESFSLGTTYSAVSSVELSVTSVHSGEIEFREIAFEGIVVPEPATALLLGLAALCAARAGASS